MEILISLIIVSTAAFILIKNVKSKKHGGCNCGSCSSHCPIYEKKEIK